MKYHYMKTHWFMGVPLLWNTLHTSDNKDVRIFRFGPVLIRVEKDENTKTPEPRSTSITKTRR